MGSNFDEFMFLAIKQATSMEDILEKFFSFLRRHTDFCHTMLSPEDIKKFNLDNAVNTRGFSPNQMVNLVKKIVEDNILQYRKTHQPYLLDNKSRTACQASATSKSVSTTQTSSVKKAQDTFTSHAECFKDPSNGKNSKNLGDVASAGNENSEGFKKQNNTNSAKYTINPWNGSITEKYAWTQSFKELTVEIVCPERLNSKNVSVVMTKNRLTVKILDKVLVDGELCRQINNYESVWNIEDGCRIIINIEKVEEYWWDCVIKGDETIDTQEIESVKKLSDFTESEQSAIMKMMSDHRKKNM